MNNLLTAIFTKISGSALSDALNGRIYLDQYPDDEMPAIFPYCTVFVVSYVPDDVFGKLGKNVLIQFSIFSTSASVTEISAIYDALMTLFADCSLTITSNNLVWFRWQNLVTMTEAVTTVSGDISCKIWHVDFEVITQES